ncbi:MAG TPA: flavin reductase family protein [Actinomycetota bacterium]|nr:flavin reductase family protein [Actinomycetota bacterium]
MAVAPDELKDALRKFASGVTVVTVSCDGELHGMTATAFASVSLDPPLVLVCLERSTHTHGYVTRAGSFVVNVLTSQQEDVARAFAVHGAKSFDGLGPRRGVGGAPLLDGALAWIECEVSEVVRAGDHDVVFGTVVACDARSGRPLLYFDRGYRSLA